MVLNHYYHLLVQCWGISLTPSYLVGNTHKLWRQSLIYDIISYVTENPTVSSSSSIPHIPPQKSDTFRILTWNILAQALAVEHDNFVGLPDGTLNWTERRLRILHEILLYNPDVICLQVSFKKCLLIPEHTYIKIY